MVFAWKIALASLAGIAVASLKISQSFSEEIHAIDAAVAGHVWRWFRGH